MKSARVLPSLRIPTAELCVVALAAALSWLCRSVPADLPFLAPWDFSWTAFLGLGLPLVWFVRGSRAGAALPPARTACFLAGIACLWFVLLTRFEYLAQHAFFLNRIQHAVLHHLGPFLIALAWPVAPIRRGTLPVVRQLFAAPLLHKCAAAVRQPVIAVLLFEGLLALWLIPPVTFRAMLDHRLYWVMNTSMAVDGVLFWFLVLDPRPPSQAGISFVTRLCLGFLIIFPQIGLGTGIGLVQHDIYPSFGLCGRLFPSITALADQQIGSLIIWIPAGMMSAIGTLITMQRMFTHEDALVIHQPAWPHAH
jgi:putative membrane protein